MLGCNRRANIYWLIYQQLINKRIIGHAFLDHFHSTYHQNGAPRRLIWDIRKER